MDVTVPGAEVREVEVHCCVTFEVGEAGYEGVGEHWLAGIGGDGFKDMDAIVCVAFTKLSRAKYAFQMLG